MAQAPAQTYHSYESWLPKHQLQLQTMGLPQPLWKGVHQKLYGQTYDVLDSLSVLYVQDEGFRVVCGNKDGLRKEADVWLLDHCFTDLAERFEKRLKETPELVERFLTMFEVERHVKEKEQKRVDKAKAKSAVAAAPVAAVPKQSVPSATTECDPETVSLVVSACDGKVSEAQACAAFKKCNGDLVATVMACKALDEPEDETVRELNKQMEAVAVAQQAESQPSVAADTSVAESAPAPPAAAGAAAAEAKAPVAAADPVAATDPAAVAAQIAKLPIEKQADLVFRSMLEFKHYGTYATLQPPVKAGESPSVETIMYVNDEVGTAIRRSSESPNCRLKPLVCVTMGGLGYSVLWITKDVKESDEITRDVDD